MANLNLIVLYVEDPAVSTAFYRDLLGKAPAVQAPNFVGFDLTGGMTLGLWRTSKAEPAPLPAGGSEIGVMIDGDASVAACFEAWKAKGHRIAQPLMDLDFGPTFVILDPDGHRIRVCEPDKR